MNKQPDLLNKQPAFSNKLPNLLLANDDNYPRNKDKKISLENSIEINKALKLKVRGTFLEINLTTYQPVLYVARLDI